MLRTLNVLFIAVLLLNREDNVSAQCNGTFFPNPLTSLETADPGVLRVGTTIYTYNTGGCSSGGVYPIRSSANTDRVSWTARGHIFSGGRYPSWATGCNNWAPEVHLVQGRYVCYFAARRASTNKMCIGVATSTSPTGPFTDIGAPLVSESTTDQIDPTCFKDPVSGKVYLLWKKPSGLYLSELQANGTVRVGTTYFLLQRDTAWEGPNVEAPSMVYRNGYYLLFYSGNVYWDDAYGVGVARATSVTGPYSKNVANPILKSNMQFGGPGHQFLFEESAGKWTMFYHARTKASGSATRRLLSDPVLWNASDWPYVSGGTPSEGWGGCDYVLDNLSAGFTASSNWSARTPAADKYGSDYRFRLTESLSDPAEWSTSVSPGVYRVSAWWSQGINRSTSAPYVIPNGTTVRVNQQVNGGMWNSLGMQFMNGLAATKLSCWTTPLGYVVMADAIRYRQVGR